MPENETLRTNNEPLKIKTIEIPSCYGFNPSLVDIEYEKLKAAFKEVAKNIPATMSGADQRVVSQFLKQLSDFEQLKQVNQRIPDKNTFQIFMSMASQAMLADIFDTAKKIGLRYRLGADYSKAIELVKIDHSYCLDVKFGKFSLLDLNRNHVSSIQERLRLLISPLIIYENPEDKQALELFRMVCQENMNEFNSDFPNTNIEETHLSMLLTTNLCLLKRRVECSSAANSYQKEACAAFNSLYDKVRQTREEFYEILMDPNHPKYQEFMSFFIDNYSKYPADFLDVCFVFSIPNLQKTFRRAKELAKNSKYAFIYELIRDSVSDTSVLNKGGDLSIPISDIDQVLDFEKTKASDMPEPKMSEIGQRINVINSLACTLRIKDKFFSLRPDGTETDWGFINPPKVVNLELDKNNPYTKFTLSFEWSNEKTKESFSFKCSFDTKRGLFEWSFLEDPKDPDFLFVRTQILRSTATALDQIANELMILIKKQNNCMGKEARQNIPARIKTEKVHFHDEIYEIRKNNGENEISPSDSIFGPDLKKELSENRIFLKKLKICEPKFWQEENLFKGLNENEIASLKQAMQEYNETGTGDMVKMLSREKSFRLKVGKYRIIFDMIETSTGSKLVPISAQHRKEVYRQY